MSRAAKPRINRDLLGAALRPETSAGAERLSAWMAGLQASDKIDILFELETWLVGLRSFFDIDNLPLSAAERADVLNRDFSPEIRIARQVMADIEHLALEVLTSEPTDALGVAPDVPPQYGGDPIGDRYGIVFDQVTPADSLADLAAGLNDLRVLIDAQTDATSLQVFISLGRNFQRHLSTCRYINLLMSQRFKLQYDRIDIPLIGGMLRSVQDDNLRENLASALLQLFRFQKYLRIVGRDLAADLPLRRTLVIFSLISEEMSRFSEFLKSRFLKGRLTTRSLRNAADFIIHLINGAVRQDLYRNLGLVSKEAEAPAIYKRIEYAHRLLRNASENGIVTLMQALDRKFEGKSIFPSLTESLQQAQKLQQDLWNLRMYSKDALAHQGGADAGGFVARLHSLRDSSLRYLKYQDLGKLDKMCDSLISTGNPTEVRALLNQIADLLENLVLEISQMSVFA
jgi:hypothetical protein